MASISITSQQIRDDIIVRYNTYCSTGGGLEKQLACLEVGRNNTYQGQMTDPMMRKITKRLAVWQNSLQAHNAQVSKDRHSSRKRLIFITLTLSSLQRHSDIQIKQKLLKPFLRVLRKDYGADNYIWKAELQENGRIHFHVVTDIYIAKEKLTSEWNHIQNKLLYIDRFEEHAGHRSPPSTHVQVVRTSKDLDNYIAKYISKKEQDKKIKGAVCYTSKNLVSLKYYAIDESQADADRIAQAVQRGIAKLIVHDHFQVVIPVSGTVADLLSPTTKLDLNAFYLQVYDFLYSSGVNIFNPFVNKEGKKESVFKGKKEKELPSNSSVATKKEPEQLLIPHIIKKPHYAFE